MISSFSKILPGFNQPKANMFVASFNATISWIWNMKLTLIIKKQTARYTIPCYRNVLAWPEMGFDWINTLHFYFNQWVHLFLLPCSIMDSAVYVKWYQYEWTLLSYTKCIIRLHTLNCQYVSGGIRRRSVSLIMCI